MTRTDTSVVGTLACCSRSSRASRRPGPRCRPAVDAAPPSARRRCPARRPYREGVLGRPVSVSPLTARTQADATSSRSSSPAWSATGRRGRRARPGRALVGRRRPARPGPSTCATTPRWHDGEPVTADDVVFTIRRPPGPGVRRSGRGSWSEVTVRPIGDADRVVSPSRPRSAGSSRPRPSRSSRRTCWLCPGRPARRRSVRPAARSAPDRSPLVDLDATRPSSVPRRSSAHRDASPADPVRRPPRPIRWRRPPTDRPTRPCLPGRIEFRFFDDQSARRRPTGPATSTALRPDAGAGPELGATPAAAAPALSGLDADGRAPQPATEPPGVRRRRRSGPRCSQAIDRDRLISTRLRDGGDLAPTAPSRRLAAVRRRGRPAGRRSTGRRPRRRSRRPAGRKEADGWHLPRAKEPLTIELISPDAAPTRPPSRPPRPWPPTGRRSASRSTHVPLPPGDLVDGPAGHAATSRRRSRTCRSGSTPTCTRCSPRARRSPAARTSSGPGPGARQAAGGRPRAGHDDGPDRRLFGPPDAAGEGSLPAPAGLRGRVDRGPDTLNGPVVRQVADPADRFWDVLTWRLAADR